MFHQTEVALLDQIQKQHAAAHIPLGDGYHQTEIRFRQFLTGKIISLRHAAGQILFLFRCEKGHLADLLEVHADRIVRGNVLLYVGGIGHLLVGDFFDGGQFLVVGYVILINGGKLIVADLQHDIRGVQLLAERIHILLAHAQISQSVEILRGQRTGLAGLLPKFPQFLFQLLIHFFADGLFCGRNDLFRDLLLAAAFFRFLPVLRFPVYQS